MIHHLPIQPSVVFYFLSPQISTSVQRGSTTAERTPCASTPPAPSCASATRATSGSTTIPAQVNSDGRRRRLGSGSVVVALEYEKTDSPLNIRRTWWPTLIGRYCLWVFLELQTKRSEIDGRTRRIQFGLHSRRLAGNAPPSLGLEMPVVFLQLRSSRVTLMTERASSETPKHLWTSRRRRRRRVDARSV